MQKSMKVWFLMKPELADYIVTFTPCVIWISYTEKKRNSLNKRNCLLQHRQPSISSPYLSVITNIVS